MPKTKQPDMSSGWREMNAPDGSRFRLPPYCDANRYVVEGYSFQANAKPKPKAKTKSFVDKVFDKVKGK